MILYHVTNNNPRSHRLLRSTSKEKQSPKSRHFQILNLGIYQLIVSRTAFCSAVLYQTVPDRAECFIDCQMELYEVYMCCVLFIQKNFGVEINLFIEDQLQLLKTSPKCTRGWSRSKLITSFQVADLLLKIESTRFSSSILFYFLQSWIFTVHVFGWD